MNTVADILSDKSFPDDPQANTNQTDNEDLDLFENNDDENNDIDNDIDDAKDNDNDNDAEKTNSAENNFERDEIRRMIYAMKDQLNGVLRILDGYEAPKSPIYYNTDFEVQNLESGEKIIEGVFNGEKMIGADGQEYAIPPNYASKSKLVEGDMMKLTIAKNGSFIYKQIGPINRKRIVGKLIMDKEAQKWFAIAEDKQYKILTASVTFFKGKDGDEAIILVPEDGESEWGAVENIITK